MLRPSFGTLVVVVGVVLSAPSAGAITFNKNGAYDSDGHRTRQEHVNYCQENRYQCLQNLGHSPRFFSQAPQCRISFDQCLNR